MTSPATATASAEVTSGPQVGDSVGAFTVTKVAGNPDDGFAVGRSGCYRCKTGSKPVVMVFARSADEKLAKLLKKIEEEVEEHQDEKLMSFVNMIGADAESLKKATEEFAAKHGITRIAFVVPEDAKDGPADGRMFTAEFLSALKLATDEVFFIPGVDRARVAIIGELPDYLTASGYRVRPFVGWAEPPIAYAPDPAEVSEVFEVPLAFFLDPRNHRRESTVYRGQARQFWAMPWEGRYIWGATAGMLVTFQRIVSP
jgi:hypothetical protein